MIEQPGHHNRPRIDELPHNLFQFTEPLVYNWAINGVLNRLTVNASPEEPFVFDGASIPPVGTFISWILPGVETIYPMGMHIYATAFHDFTFSYQGRLPIGAHEVLIDGQWVDSGKVWTFTECNRLFGRQMKEDGVGRTERNIMQVSVQSPIGYYCWITGKIPEDARPKA